MSLQDNLKKEIADSITEREKERESACVCVRVCVRVRVCGGGGAKEPRGTGYKRTGSLLLSS